MKKIFSLLILLGLPACAALAQEDTAPAAATGPVETATSAVALEPAATATADPQPFAPPDGYIEKKAAIVKVDGFTVYVDAGAAEGVDENTPMLVYRLEPVRNLQGEVLDRVEETAGTLKVTEVRPRMSICRPTSIRVPFERGFFVKYYVSPQAVPDRSEGGRCPSGMLYDGGGPFAFKAGSMFTNIPPSDASSGETGPFCIDQYPVKTLSTWADARDSCAARGKRLCQVRELQKVCSTWEKPKFCPPEMEKTTGCPEPSTVVDFRSDLEWSYEAVAMDSGLLQDAFSCKCPGSDPVCVHCYYEGCRGAKKYYRCCTDPR